ncbi:MAG: mechanosensitive ion channel [Actinomycetota bacterium]|nr:mechanosensitive ion channel [Actinomycetota bacterium]
MIRRAPDLMHSARWGDWLRALLTSALAIALMELAIYLHRDHHLKSEWLWTLLIWLLVVALVTTGSFAVRFVALALGKLETARRGIATGAIVRLVATGLGFVVLLFAVFAAFGLSVQRLLIGAGLAGIIVGIAAQQSLANIFASLVLLFARPFHVGDDIVVHSGALGLVEGQVRGIGLTYVTLRTKDGSLKIPNSAMLAAGIGRRPPAPAPPADDGTR